MEDNKNIIDHENEIIDEETVNQDQNDKSIIEDEVSQEEPAKNEEAAKTQAQEENDKAAEYLERLQRLMAEFDNYRKRSQKEKADAYDFAVGGTVVELLPIIDNFERALKVESEDKAFYEGVTMIYKQFIGFLENINVTPIEAKDQVFDPNLHNAILHIEDENYGENIVVEELQKGYLYKEKVIRHSMVKVAN
ncbi:nucleotide exchange factor GrpE [Cellulosilyticum sp. I15G10I2]|uniref:nucleotide exchange factor GrpE n=1 Tax=Cellulosilyticum sp. I15G10I2 TaxID=1892843 RepID=UPI00085C12E9|nr:nucleotide exchange factor GrpE [Cellulosilyticum sp. I15G10I2]